MPRGAKKIELGRWTIINGDWSKFDAEAPSLSRGRADLEIYSPRPGELVLKTREPRRSAQK